MGSSVQAFIAFLKTEATQAEQRAKSLRATAATIEANSLNNNDVVVGGQATNTTTTSAAKNSNNKKRRKSGEHVAAAQQSHASTADAASLAGSSNGTTTKLNHLRGVHTAYTLFLHECFEIMQKSHPGSSPGELIGLMNRQWVDINPEEKRLWKSRAEQMKEQNMNPMIMAVIDDSDDHEFNNNHDEGDGCGDNNNSKKQRTTSAGGRKVDSGSTKKEDYCNV